MKSLLWSLLFALACQSSTANETARLAIGEWAPFTSETDPNGKLLEHVVSEAFKLVGVDVVYRYFPWARSYRNIETGSYDGTFPWNKTEERDAVFYIPKQSIIKDEGVYFHLKTTAFDWNDLQDLKKYRVGVTIGYKQEKTYADNQIMADPVPSEELNFKKMLVGRVDVFQTSKRVGYMTIRKLFSPEDAARFTNHPKPVEIDEYYVLFSKKSPKGKYLSEKFDEGMQALKKSGRYQELIAAGVATH